MVSTFLTLLSLQKIDKDLIEIRKEITEKKSQVSNDQIDKDNVQDEVSRLELEIGQTERLFEQSNSEVDESTAKVKKWEKRMQEIKNQREQQALLREIDHLKQQRDLLKNQAEEIESRLSLLKAQHEESQAELNLKTAKYEEINKTISGDLESLVSKQEKLEKKKNSGSQSLDKAVFSKYKRISARRQGLAVAEVNNQQCMGCNRMVTPQMWNTMHTRLDLFQCPSCQRYLFIMERLLNEAEVNNVKIDGSLFTS